MSRILFAWELGGGYGHLGPFLPVAKALLARGHDLTVAARDVERAHAAFDSLAVTVERFLLSSNLEKLGMARVVHPDTQPLDIGGALAHVQRASHVDAARQFASRHREPAVDTIIKSAAGRIELLARGTQGQPG